MTAKYIYQSILFIGLIISILSSCSEDSFTKIVNVELAEEDQQLAVVAQMTTTGDTQHILVSETLSIFENSDFTSLSNAKISLTTPDQGTIEPVFDPELNLYTVQDYRFKEGQNYSITIDHPDYAPMTASTQVPNAPEIIDVNLQIAEVDSLDDGTIIFKSDPDILTIKLKDPPNESNSYLINAFITIENDSTGETLRDDYRFEINDNLLQYNDNVISDITFNGKEYELILLGTRNIKYWPAFFEGTSLHSFEIEIISISEELVQYENSIDQAYDSNDNPFVEPSTIFTNFDNGFGIFTVDAIETIEIML